MREAADIYSGITPDVERRLRSKVSPPNGSGCMLWTGCVNNAGYGIISVNRRARLAHRVAFMIKNGDIAPWMAVCHRCDNPPCCNPDHLFVGSSMENTADMFKKGRAKAGGSVAGSALLSQESVLEIRRLYREGWSCPKIGKKTGVSRFVAWATATGRRYANVYGQAL